MDQLRLCSDYRRCKVVDADASVARVNNSEDKATACLTQWPNVSEAKPTRCEGAGPLAGDQSFVISEKPVGVASTE